MNIYPAFTNVRSFTAYQFSKLRMQGLWESAFAKLSGNNSTLKIFPKSFRRENHLRKNIGLNTIRVNEIVGTLNRRSDLSLNRDGWSPILVHKIGNEYYVEDGHHRVSIAWSMGMVYIEAIVWEYCQDTQPKNNCLPHSHVERSCIRVYATR
jgi:hypothetical protein